MQRINIMGRDGKVISVVEWTDVKEPKGIVQIAHGMAEHAMRYDMFAQRLNEMGYIVVADDHRAHGETDAETHGYSEGDIWENTLADMAVLMYDSINKFSKIYKKELDVVIFGHSYGSFLTQEFLKRHRRDLKGAVLCGSSYFDGLTASVGKFVSKIAIIFGKEDKPNKFLAKMSFDVYNKKFKEGTFISSLKDECERYEQDKNCGFICSSNFYYCFFKGVKKLYKNQGNNLENFPVLIISGDHDPVGNMGKGVRKLEEWYKSKNADVRCTLYEGVRHEVLNDTSREDAIKEVGEFLKERFLIKEPELL